MFIRKKLNRSGTISVQVIDKRSGRYRAKKTIGSSSDPKVIEQLLEEGKSWIKTYLGQIDIFFLLDARR